MNDWTVETLHEHIDRLLLEREKHFDAVLHGVERQIAELRDHQEELATKLELERIRESLDSRFAVLTDPERGVYAKMGRSEQRLRSWAIALLTSMLMLLIGLTLHIAGVH